MFASVLATATDSVTFKSPHLDWHALAPEAIVVATILIVLLVDLFTERHNKWLTSVIAGIGTLGSLVPILTLAVHGHSQSMFGGAYVVDDFALVMKAVFLIAGYITVLLSNHYIGEGDYWEGEYYLLLASSVLGMMVMASARDLIGIFVALELLSIPAYLLAGWRKRELTGNEAGMKYYLMGVFASAVMLYGMSLIYGGTGSTVLVTIGQQLKGSFGATPAAALGIVFVLVGFAFKVSAVPFHNWAPDTYEGAPTPVTAFLSVASKAAGFVAIMELIFVGFYGRPHVYGPMIWVLSVATMTVGNLIALRQTNVVRMLAYSSVAQAGFILALLAVVGHSSAVADDAIRAIVSYLIIYTAMNLGAFAVIIAVSRKTKSGELESWGGLFEYALGLTVVHDRFRVRAGRHPAARRVVRQVPGVQGDPRSGRAECRGAGRRGRSQLGHRALLLRERGTHDVVRAGARRRRGADQGAGRHRRSPLPSPWSRPCCSASSRAPSATSATPRPTSPTPPSAALTRSDLARLLAAVTPLEELVAEQCRRFGSVPFDQVMDLRSTTPSTASTRRGARPAGGGTSSPASRSGRCSGR